VVGEYLITGLILQEKALIFQKKCNGGKPDFKASADNFDHWEKLYRLQQLNISGRKLSANWREYLKFKVEFHCVTDSEGLPGEQIHNCDYTCLKMLPSKTPASWAEASAPVYKQRNNWQI
jgi:hypothetical protein